MPWPSTSPQQTILCVGDSITEGVGASTFHGRWLDLLQDDLRSANPTSGIGDGGGVAYLPAWRSSTVGNRTATTATRRGRAACPQARRSR